MAFTFEAREGRQGKHRYFTTSLRWDEIEKLAVFHEQLPELDEDQRMQRGLASARLATLRDYLTTSPDHFFSALTLVILPRDLERSAQEATTDGEDSWDYAFRRSAPDGPGPQRRGTLHLSGSVRLFPADGQHRMKAALEAINVDPYLAREEVPVVIIPYEMPAQVRQLFSDLNLNAKPVSRTIGLDFDTRDRMTELAKRAARVIPLFQGRVNRRTNSLPAASDDVITLNALVGGTRKIVSGLAHRHGVDEDEFLNTFPNAPALVLDAWQKMLEAFSTYWNEVVHGVVKPSALRAQFVFPHALGWLAVTEAARQLMIQREGHWAEAFRHAIEAIDWSRANPQWQSIATSGTDNRINNTGPGVTATAARIVLAAPTEVASES